VQSEDAAATDEDCDPIDSSDYDTELNVITGVH
jgi:hypothetical protein